MARGGATLPRGRRPDGEERRRQEKRQGEKKKKEQNEKTRLAHLVARLKVGVEVDQPGNNVEVALPEPNSQEKEGWARGRKREGGMEGGRIAQMIAQTNDDSSKRESPTSTSRETPP